MREKAFRRLLLLTDDEFTARSIGMYLHDDGIDVVPLPGVAEANGQIGAAAGILVDLVKRNVDGESIIALSWRARRSKIPMLVLSAQPRRDVAQFAAVLCATDVVSKSEPMGAIAARLRMWINGDAAMQVGFEIPEIAVGA